MMGFFWFWLGAMFGGLLGFLALCVVSVGDRHE